MVAETARTLVFYSVCETNVTPFIMCPAAHPGALRSALRGRGGLLGVPGGDGAGSGPHLHPHRLSQTQPPRPRQSGICRVGNC